MVLGKAMYVSFLSLDLTVSSLERMALWTHQLLEEFRKINHIFSLQKCELLFKKMQQHQHEKVFLWSTDIALTSSVAPSKVSQS